MKYLITFILCVTVPLSAAEVTGHKVVYDGGSISSIKPGISMRIQIDPERIRLATDKSEVAIIKPSSVTEISYGQDVHRRVGTAIGLAVVSFGIGALMALAKSKKHYVGITWDDEGKKGGIAFQADKSDYRGVLTGLEGVTGKKTVNTDTKSVKN